VAAVAAAQEPSPPPLPPVEPEPVAAPAAPAAPPPAPVEPSYFERCFAYPAVYFAPAPRFVVAPLVAVDARARPAGPPPNEFHAAQPATSSSGGSGSVDGKAALIIAALALVALPVVVYALDRDADPLVVQRFHCPSVSFEGAGGAAFVPGRGLSAPLLSGRLTAGYSYVGADFQFDVTAAAGGVAGHALLRVLPKQHVEGALALGYRSMFLEGRVRDGFELGLPHRYVFHRSGLNGFGLELRPMFLFGGGGVDAAIEATLVVPLFELLSARVGGRVLSFGSLLVWTAQGGLTFTW
jgi:hypothetical protein